MLGDSLWKKKPSKKAAKYPTYVGDLPVKIIQDIIDNLGISGDWKTIAGRTGISERQVRLLTSKHQNETDIARIVFDQWLCRIPKPKDLANLLMCVNRFGDIRKLKPYIDPKEWSDIENRMERQRGGPPRPPPGSAGDTFDTDSNAPPPDSRRIASSEEETNVPLPTSLSPVGDALQGPGSSISRNSSLTARSVPDSHPRRGAPSEKSDDVLSYFPSVPQHGAEEASFRRDVTLAGYLPGVTASVPPPPQPPPRQAEARLTPPTDEVFSSEVEKMLTYTLEFEYQPEVASMMEMMSGRHDLLCYFYLGRYWVAKNFSAKGLRKLYRELTFLTRFRHPNILQLSGYVNLPVPDVELPLLYLVYPLMENYSLEHFLTSQNQNVSDLNFRLDLMRQIGDALAYIHSQNFVHGDVSMRNVLIDRYMRPVLADFELAQSADEDEADQALGPGSDYIDCTSPYAPIAPNMGFTIDRDVYAFGILLALVYTQHQWRQQQAQGETLVRELFTTRRPPPNQEHTHRLLEDLCLHCIDLETRKDKLMMAQVVMKLQEIINQPLDDQASLGQQPKCGDSETYAIDDE